MKKPELHEKFICALENRFTKRSILVTEISEILKIERDSANRRLAGKVQFSIREMGILAQTLGVSIDELLYDDTALCSELLIMEKPGFAPFSNERLIKEIQSYSNLWRKICKQSYSEYGALISSLPAHIYAYYPLLLKLACFKWAHYIENFKEGFTQYNVPQNLAEQIEKLKESFCEIKYLFYIWNSHFMQGVVNDINYFRSMGLLEQTEIDLIKEELSTILYTLEKSLAANESSLFPGNTKTEHYVSSVDIEISASYIWSNELFHSYIFTFFMHSATFSDQSRCLKIRNWINSMKKVSTLISGSGEMARSTFLKIQHQCLHNL